MPVHGCLFCALLMVAPQELGWKRSDIVVSTKVFWGGDGPNDKGLSRKHIIEGTKVRELHSAGCTCQPGRAELCHLLCAHSCRVEGLLLSAALVPVSVYCGWACCYPASTSSSQLPPCQPPHSYVNVIRPRHAITKD